MNPDTPPQVPDSSDSSLPHRQDHMFLSSNEPQAATSSGLRDREMSLEEHLLQNQADSTNALATLAQAAAGRRLTPKRQSPIPEMHGIPPSPPRVVGPTMALIVPPGQENKPNDKESWFTVGIIQGDKVCVKDYFYLDNVDSLNLENLPDCTDAKRIPLQSGTAFKFRVAGINSVGIGPWSDLSAFKTCLPGYPGAPSQIKISKSHDGAHLTWDPPARGLNDIKEYSVYLAVRNQKRPDSPKEAVVPLSFIRVYCGAPNSCVVSNQSLSAAHIDSSSAAKQAIIFRIAAKNSKGYGPATQVRWLQGNVTYN